MIYISKTHLTSCQLMKQASTKHKTSKFLVMINTTNHTRFLQLGFRDTRELQQSVIASKLTQKDLYTRKCVYILNDLFDNRLCEKCVRTDHEAWMVWNFSNYKQPVFTNDTPSLTDAFPVFPNVYRVCVKRNANQSFLSCSCLHYDRCGIPCSHVLAITNVLEDSMVKVEHWRVYAVYFGIENSPLSEAIMKSISVQSFNEGYGTPISNESLLQCLKIPSKRYVIHMLMNRVCISDIPTNGKLLNQYYMNY
jgi:hypothetical protein